MSAIPRGFKLGIHNPFAVPNLIEWAVRLSLSNRKLREKVVELEAQVVSLRKGGSIAPPVT